MDGEVNKSGPRTSSAPHAAAYEYRHVVTLEETNSLGNVYFTRHVSWQGRCRELFLKEKAPGVLEELARDLRLVTLFCTCEYFAELCAFDEVIICMRLKGITQNRIALHFEYWRSNAKGNELVARGEQEIASMLRGGAHFVPMPLPPELLDALKPYV